MAASRDLRSRVTDLATCPICLELFNSPKSLPCLHTFCLKCIAGHCRDNEPGDEVACPVCRQEFNIPKSGVRGLLNNFFIADLVEARKTASDVVVQVPCGVCLRHDKNAAATKVCVTCNKKMCERCSTRHSRRKGGQHEILPIDNEIKTELVRAQGGKCDKHRDEDVRLYCMDCKMNICVMCVADEHQQHRCENVDVVAAECVKQIDADLVQVEKRADGARKEISRFEIERRKFIGGAEDARCKLIEKGEELKKLIDAQVNVLMLEVQSLKTMTCKEIESLKDGVEMKLLMFETFSAYCSELKTKGKPCDITRAANDLHSRATELLQKYTKLEDYCTPAIMFTSMNIHELLDSRPNFIGRITANDSTVTSSFISFVTRRDNTLEQQLAQSTYTEHSLTQQLEDNDKMWTQKVNELQTQVKQLKQRETVMEAQCEQLRITELQTKQKSGSSNSIMKKYRRSTGWTSRPKLSNRELEPQKKSESSLNKELEAEQLNERHFKEHKIWAAASVKFNLERSTSPIADTDSEAFEARRLTERQLTPVRQPDAKVLPDAKRGYTWT